MEIDNEKCMAFVKSQNRQCHNKQKLGYDLCGVHLKAKTVVRVDSLVDSFVKKTKELVLDDEPVTVTRKKSAFTLPKSQIEKLRKIQSWGRRWIVKIRVESRTKPEPPVNMTDFLYDTHYLEMPEALYFDFYDSDKKRYFFDIRALKTHVDTSGMTNPYTRNEIPEDSQKLFLKKIDDFEKKGKKAEVEKTVFKSKSQEVEMRVFEVFQKINALDNYVNHDWFLEMNVHQLRRLYKVCEDTFNYRSQLPPMKKRELVKDGIAFSLKHHEIDYINSLTRMRELCITELERFATEGKTKDDCKLGTMLMLTAFVEVCPKAAAAEEMALYVQNMADGLY